MRKTVWLSLFVLFMFCSSSFASGFNFDVLGDRPKVVSAGQYLAIATSDEIQIWDVKNQQMINQFTLNQFIDFFSGLQPMQIKIIKTNGMVVSSMSLADNGKALAFVRGEEKPYLLIGKKVVKLPMKNSRALSAVISPNGKYVGIPLQSGSVSSLIIDTETGNEVLSIPRKYGFTGAMAFSEASVFISVGKFVLEYDLKSAKRKLKLKSPIRIGKGSEFLESVLSDDNKFFVVEDKHFMNLELKKFSNGSPDMANINGKTVFAMYSHGGYLNIIKNNLIVDSGSVLSIYNLKNVQYNADLNTGQFDPNLYNSLSYKHDKVIPHTKTGPSHSSGNIPVIIDGKVWEAHYEEELGDTTVSVMLLDLSL